MKTIHFFALREDLLALLELVESKGPLKYALTGNFAKDELKAGVSVFDAGAKIPNLGKAAGDSSTICDAYLVCDGETPINLRHLDAVDDSGRVCLDQLAITDSVVFLPGGAWDGSVVIQGHVGTASDSQLSQALMKRFQAAIKKSFTKVKAFYVGPNAMTRLEKGERLTNSARSPREYDLALT